MPPSPNFDTAIVLPALVTCLDYIGRLDQNAVVSSQLGI
jgi:hypothetical protein